MDVPPRAYRVIQRLSRVLVHVLILSIKAYRYLLSPLLPRSCRFYPSCSQYALEALQQHGLFRGSWLALRRISSCHPFHAGGYDPVPPSSSNSASPSQP